MVHLERQFEFFGLHALSTFLRSQTDHRSRSSAIYSQNEKISRASHNKTKKTMLPLLIAGTIGLIGALSYAFKPFIVPKLLEATAWPADPAIGKIPQAKSPEELRPRYQNKRVLVVGGTRGVGFGLAQACSRAGAHVTIVGRSLQSAQDALSALGDNASFIQGDIGTVASAKETVQRIEEFIAKKMRTSSTTSWFLPPSSPTGAERDPTRTRTGSTPRSRWRLWADTSYTRT